MLQMSQRDRDRLVVVRQVAAGKMAVSRAAQVLGLSRRQVYRLVERFHEEGDGAVVHRARGRPPNNAKDGALRVRALERARDPIFEGFGPTLLREHLIREPALAALDTVHVTTFRLWMIQDGRWKARRRGQRHRKARPRRAAVGELIQMDGSDHAWFEDRYPGRLCLLKMIDDATNRLMMARFVPRETGAACRQLIVDYLRTHGRPVALYTDKAGQFGKDIRFFTPHTPLEERESEATDSIIRRALKTLNVDLILANSPQAKGRVERDFGTSQDRLVKELRVAGISTIEEGNAFLDAVFIPFWTERFAVPPAVAKDAHRPLAKRVDLDRLFSETCTRSVAADYTFRWANRRYQIPKHQARGIAPRTKITVETQLDGTTGFWFGNRRLDVQLVAELPKALPRPRPAPSPVAARPPKPRPAPPRPGPDHPWRRANQRDVQRARLRAAARLAPSTPSASGD